MPAYEELCRHFEVPVQREYMLSLAAETWALQLNLRREFTEFRIHWTEQKSGPRSPTLRLRDWLKQSADRAVEARGGIMPARLRPSDS